MSRIITIGREFGSGGREVGRRLATAIIFNGRTEPFCVYRAEQYHLDRELKQQILSIDKRQSKYYQLYTDQTWGDKSNHDLCINTTFINIKDIACSIAKSM